MRLREIMTRPARTVRPDATLQAAAAMMRVLDAGFLPVCEEERVVGVLSERDLVAGGTARGMDPMLAKVREVMTRDVVYAYEDQEVDEAVLLMEQRRIGRLVVLDRSMRLVGVVTLHDAAPQTRAARSEAGGRARYRGDHDAGGVTLH